MRLAQLDGRAVLVVDRLAVDVERASDGRFGSDVQALFGDWAAFRAWGAGVSAEGGIPIDPLRLGAPVPRPGQVFAIGVNYVEHAAEAGYPADSLPVTFTKFPSCLTGPAATVDLPSEFVDWEVELVIAIGRRAVKVQRAVRVPPVVVVSLAQHFDPR